MASAVAESTEGLSDWHRKEAREESARMMRALLRPADHEMPSDVVTWEAATGGSIHVELGPKARWVWSKLKAVFEIIPAWQVKAAEARKLRAEARTLELENQILNKTKDARAEDAQDELRAKQEERMLEMARKRIALIGEAIELLPKDVRKRVPPEALWALATRLVHSLDAASDAASLGTLLVDQEMLSEGEATDATTP